MKRGRKVDAGVPTALGKQRSLASDRLGLGLNGPGSGACLARPRRDAAAHLGPEK